MLDEGFMKVLIQFGNPMEQILLLGSEKSWEIKQNIYAYIHFSVGQKIML